MWRGLLRDLAQSRSISRFGERLPAGDMAYAGQQVSLDPIDVSDYRDMLRDATVASSLEVRLVGMLPGVSVIPARERDERARKAADVVEQCFALMVGSPLQMFREVAFEGLAFGFTVAEPVWMLTADGIWTLRAIKPKRAESMRSALVADEYGNLEGIKQAAPNAPDFVSAAEIIYWRHRGGWYELTGKSALYEAHDPWRAKMLFDRAWAIYLSRHGQGILKWKLPESVYQRDLSRIKEIMRNLQTGTGIALRSGVDELDLLESSGSPGRIYQDYHQAMDKAIVRAILYQELATGEGIRVGSFAASETQADVMWSVLRIQGEAFLESVGREQVARRFLERNGYGDLPCPIILPETIVASPTIAEALRDILPAIQSGVLPPLTAEQAQDVYAYYGLSASIQEKDRSVGELASPSHRHRHKLSELEDEMNAADDAAASEIATLWAKSVPAILSKIEATLWKGGSWKVTAPGTIRDAVSVAIKSNGEQFREILSKHLSDRFNAGRASAKAARRSKTKARLAPVAVIPQLALDALKQGAYLALQTRYDEMAGKVYHALMRAIQGRKSVLETAERVRQILASEGFTLAQALTLVRTEMAGAYNQGRLTLWQEFEYRGDDPKSASGDQIIGYRFDAVMDGVTTEECQERNGRIFAPDDVDVPPLHFNCRSVLEPVWRDELETPSDVDALPWATREDMKSQPGFEKEA